MSGHTGVFSEGVLRLWDLTRLCSKEHHSVAFSSGFQIVSIFCDLTIKIWKCKYSKYHKKENDSDTQIRWSDLDRVILEHVLRLLCYRDSLRFGSVCRWWRTVQAERIYPPSRHFPWILLPNQQLDSERRTLYSPSDGVCFEIRVPPKAFGKLHFASYHGWLLMVDRKDDDHPFLFNPFSGRQIELPEIEFNFGILDAYMSSDPSDPDCIVACPVMTPDCRLILCRVGVGDNMWTEYSGDFYTLRSMASCRGRFYCLDVRRNLITLDLDSTSTSTSMVLVPMEDGELPMMKIGKEHAMLVESCGELLMVLVAWKSSLSAMESEPDIGVQVFRADLSNLAWVKVRNLGDRVLFMGRGCSTSLSAADIGGQGNHVYFTYGFISWGFLTGTSYWCWLDFDLESRRARHWKPPRTLDNVIYQNHSFWVAPDLHGRFSPSVYHNPSASSRQYWVHDHNTDAISSLQFPIIFSLLMYAFIITSKAR